jgi:opacity protein-like surface antigen
MKNKKIILALTLTVLVFSAALSLQAQEQSKNLYGKFLFGYRFVDTSGTVERYKQDINLDDGLRLFNFSLQITPNETFQNLFDRIDINMYNFGGDPYETFRLAIQKSGKYKFQYDRRKSNYFYADQHEIDGGELYNPFTFNFDRTMDSMFFKVWLHKYVDVYVNFDRYNKKGDSTLTLDIDRIEFEFDKPIEENYKQFAIGVDFHMKNFTFVFEERVMDYTNTNSLFLPGAADGGEGARYPSELNFFTLNQPYDLKTYTHTFKATGRAFDRLLINGFAQFSNQDMDLTYAEEADGINYLGKFYMHNQGGAGKFDRNINLFDFDVTYLMFDKLAVVAAFRFNDFEQEGYLTVDGEKEEAMLKYNNKAAEGGLQYQFSPRMVVTAGYRYEIRKLDGIETVTYEEKTVRNGLYGNIKWDIRAFKITADYQFGDYNDPFTLISPTSFHRFRFTAKANVDNFNFSGSYLWNKAKSEVYDDRWDSTKNQLNIRLAYNGQKIHVSGGYSLIDVEHKGSRTIQYPPTWTGPGSFPWDILYEGKSNLLDASLSADMKNNWTLGGYANVYWNRGFWEIDRFTLKAYVEYTFDNGLVSQIGYRYVDFKEKMSGFNDYSANIIEISFGYRWK